MSKRELVITDRAQEVVEVELPEVSCLNGNMLEQLTQALGVPRDVVALDDEIEEAWSRLPRLIGRIPPHLRDEKVVKVCIAIASGLFDSAINYIWNAAIVELRQKVRQFGLHVVPQILDDKSFDEKALLDLKDIELLDLCLKLNLITDENFFFLDQCRATRNNYSVAHPSSGNVDEDEVLIFIRRCQKHALSSVQNPKGVDTKNLLDALKSSKFKRNQREEWEARLSATYDVQRELIFGMLHGIYCDPVAGEEARVNALDLCVPFSAEFTPKVKSMLVDRHQEYLAKGDEKRHVASQNFFKELGLIGLLSDLELHDMITIASKNLLRVHNSWDNFHNEPPFASNLDQLTRGIAIPNSAMATFVEAVVTCGVGNIYGVSNAAMPSYRAMVRSFAPSAIRIMLELPQNSNAVAGRIKNSTDCQKRYKNLVRLLDKSSVPTRKRAEYKKWIKQT